MRITRIGIGLIAAVALAGTAALGQGKTDPALDKLAREFVVAFNAKDPAKIAAFYAEDAVLMPPNQPMVKGRAAIEAAWKALLAEGVTDLKLQPIESGISGNHAFEAGTSTITIKGAGAAPVTDAGKYVVVYKRVGKDWKIAYDIFNSDQPPPPAQKK